MPFVSIILLHYNGIEPLNSCLYNLNKTKYPKERYEIVLVDNGSTDNSVKIIRKKYKKLKVLRIKKNIGFTGGNNFGISHILKEKKADYIALVSNDVFVDKNWLRYLVKAAEADEGIGACGPIIFNAADIVRSYGNSIDLLGREKVRTEMLEKEQVEPFYLPCCCIMIRRKVLEELEYPFDPGYFAYYEDVDLSWRIRLLGYRLMDVKRSKVIHKEKVTINVDYRRGNIYLFHNYKNKILTFRKNLRTPLQELLCVPIFFTILFKSVLFFLMGKWNLEYFSVFKYFFIPIKASKNIDKVSLKRQFGFFFNRF